MAAYTRLDVIQSLADPVLHKIAILFDGLLISGMGFVVVQRAIIDGNIEVVEGMADATAYYHGGDDRLTTNSGVSPIPYWNKALLIHECVHAMIDVYKYKTTSLTNELLSYIAQVAYEIMSNRDYKYTLNPSLAAGSNDAKWNKFWVNIENYVRGLGYSFTSNPGMVSVQNDDKFKELRTQINGLNLYQHLNDLTRSDGDGICHQMYQLPMGVSVRGPATCR